jgi:putative NADH-flavin reductase
MKTISTVAVIGGTGKSGKYLVKELISQGFSLKVFLRNPETFTISHPLIQPVKGNARDAQAVLNLISGCDAVVSTLGQPKGEPSIFSQATTNVLAAMQAFGVTRYILTTGLNVDTAADNKSPKTRFATEWMKTNYPETTSDKQEEYNLLLRSAVDWTLVRLPMIEQTDTKQGIITSLHDCPGDTISATDLAMFLTGQLSDQTFIKQAPFIASI